MVAREVFDLRDLWDEIEALDGRVAAQTQLAMLLKARILVERATRWREFGPGTAALAAAAGDVLCTADRDVARRAAEELVNAGVPPTLAGRIGYLESLVPALDLVDIAAATGLHFEESPASISQLTIGSSCTPCARTSPRYHARSAGRRSPAARSGRTSRASTVRSRRAQRCGGRTVLAGAGRCQGRWRVRPGDAVGRGPRDPQSDRGWGHSRARGREAVERPFAPVSGS
jgi:Bacterial NAD-glutamate dehydrogenase